MLWIENSECTYQKKILIDNNNKKLPDLSEVRALLAGCLVRHFEPINVSGVSLTVAKNMSHREIFL